MRVVPAHGAQGSQVRELRGPELRWGAGEYVSPHSRSALPERFCKSLKPLRKSSVESRQVRTGWSSVDVGPPLMSGMGRKQTYAHIEMPSAFAGEARLCHCRPSSVVSSG